MKMALSEFALREKGIYGVLHIVILLLSLFLVVSISVDTFKGIPFYTQTVFMKVQFAVCVLFLLEMKQQYRCRERNMLQVTERLRKMIL